MLKLPKVSPGSLNAFFDEHRPLVFKYIIRKIKNAVMAKDKEVKLFQFFGNNIVAMCPEKDYDKVLKQGMDVFIQNEMYEDAAICRDTLELIKGNGASP